MEDWKIARKKCRKFGEKKKLSDKNDPKTPKTPLPWCLQEAAAALSTRYQEQRRGGSAGSEDELRQPISASEVDEASDMVFQRSPAVPSGQYSRRDTTEVGSVGGWN